MSGAADAGHAADVHRAVHPRRTAPPWPTVAAAIVMVAIVVGAFVVAAAARGPYAGRFVAIVHDGDGATHELPLDEEGRIAVETGLGANVVVVEDGVARMAEADCPSGDCLRQRAISRPGEQIICLPHRLWVEVAVAGEGGATAPDTGAVTWEEDVGNADVDLVSR